jgi:large subunit ribosomal protein L10
MMNRQQKQTLVSEVAEHIEASKSMVFVNFRGLSVADTQTMKKELRQAGVRYRVMKKRLFDRAAKEAGKEVFVKQFGGQFAVAISMEDEVSAAKILKTFSKKHESLELLGGVLENKMISQEEVFALAALPSKQELLAKLVGSMNAPVSGLVQVLSGNIRGLACALKAIAEAKGN